MPSGTANGGEEAQANGVGAAPGQNGKLTLQQKKKLKQKQRKQAKRVEREAQQQAQASGDVAAAKRSEDKEEEVEIEYVAAPLELDVFGGPEAAEEAEEPGFAGLGATAGLGASDAAPGGGATPSTSAREEFEKVLSRFGSVDALLGRAPEPDDDGGARPSGDDGSDGEAGAAGKGDADDDSDAEGEAAKLSRRQRRVASQMKVAELKQSCERPDVVEVWDVTASDPKLLVYLKAYRNTVPIPRHWSQKRKYLQGKRGLDKPAFKLPEFIEATGIGEMRAAYLEKAEAQKLKSKGRERMQPKMGKLDLDYQVLHDAFFRHQTKPPLSGLGELYYEGKEFEAHIKHARPGVLSEGLQEALGMADGAPPPWLVNVQRYGPPPSYPSLKIPGLNAPIPPGAQFGYHIGGWGKPPVDEMGVPLYGDVFGQNLEEGDEDDLVVDKAAHWGDLEAEEEVESSSEEEEDEEEEEEEEEPGAEELADGYASVASGLASSLPSGIETPAEVDLRKGKEGPRQLYSVLEQQRAAVGAGQLMGSDHTYVIPGVTAPGAEKKALSLAAQKRMEALRKEMPSDLDVSLDPSELEGLDDGALRTLYESRLAEQRAAAGREDFSDLVAAKAAAQKRKAADKTSGKDKKFKF